MGKSGEGFRDALEILIKKVSPGQGPVKGSPSVVLVLDPGLTLANKFPETQGLELGLEKSGQMERSDHSQPSK